MERKYILAALVGFLTAILAWQAPKFLGHSGSAGAQLPETEAIHLFEPARAIPDFSLSQSDGTRLIRGELKGHWTVVFLGFTHCPDICPTTLAQFARIQKELQRFPEATRPRMLFVSVDPDRDSPSQVGDYAHSFHPDTIAATGDIASLENFARSVSMTFAKMPPDPGMPENQYSVDHSASLAIFNPSAELSGFATAPVDFEALSRDLVKLAEAK